MIPNIIAGFVLCPYDKSGYAFIKYFLLFLFIFYNNISDGGKDFFKLRRNK